MSDSPLVPCLKEPAWPGRDTVVAHPLWREASPYVPWVALGYDHPHSFEFLNREQAPAGRAPSELEREAIRNLRQRAATWQELDVKLGWFKKLKMLVAVDDFLTAERILDTTFLLEAQRKLGASGLFVGVPRRGFLIVTAVDTNVEKIRAFGAVAATQFQSGESAPITPTLFTTKNGHIVGTLDVVAQAIVPPERMSGVTAGVGDVDDDDGDDEAAAGEPYVSGMVVADKAGNEEIVIMAGGDDAEKLAQALVNALASSLSRHLGSPKFSGRVKVVVLGMTPPDVKAQMPSVEQHLKGILAEVGGKNEGRPLTLTMEYQESSLQ
jgi:hypothetical protein